MSTKGKRGKNGGAADTGPPKWEIALDAAELEDGYWKANVSLVVGAKILDQRHIDVLLATVSTGVRRLFTTVTKESLHSEVRICYRSDSTDGIEHCFEVELAKQVGCCTSDSTDNQKRCHEGEVVQQKRYTLDMLEDYALEVVFVRVLGVPKMKKAKDLPANYEVCEPCKLFLDAGEEIPLALLSRLLKYRLMHLRTEDIKRKNAERKAALDKVKGKGAVEEVKGKKDAKISAPVGLKEGSKLKKRGEEDLDSKFINDEPEDGAQLYILLIGFNNPHLPYYLSAAGVHLNCIIRISSEDYSRFPPSPLEAMHLDKSTDDAASLERMKHVQELRKFWRDIVLLLRNNADSSKLHDIAMLECEVKSHLMPLSYDDLEHKTQLGAALFDNISSMIYSLQSNRRLYETFKKNLKLINVPELLDKVRPADKEVKDTTEASAIPSTSVSIDLSPPVCSLHPDMRYYSDLMNSVPHESVSVSLIIYCMISQVIATEENKEPPSVCQTEARSDGLHSHIVEHLYQAASKLALSDEDLKYLNTSLNAPEKAPETVDLPPITNGHDYVGIRTNHLQTVYDFNPAKVERDMLFYFPLAEIFDIPQPDEEETHARANRLQELNHFCVLRGITTPEIDYSLKQFVFECMDFTTTDANGFLLTKEFEGAEHSNIPWDDPYPYFKLMVPHHFKPSLLDITETQEEDNNGKDSSGLAWKVSKGLENSDERRESFSANSPPKHQLQNSGSKRGILASTSATNSPGRSTPKSKVSCVHFDDSVDVTMSDSSGMTSEKMLFESTHEVLEAQKRILDQWNYAEHYTPHVLRQVLTEATYTLPVVEHYLCRRDQSLMLVLHSPHNEDLQSLVDWQTELHSNMGFRNYMEHIVDRITLWLKEKEEEYQVFLRSDAARKKAQEEEEPKEVEKKGKKGGRKAEPKQKTPPPSAKPEPAPLSYIRTNSIKAWNEEQERIRREEEEAEKKKKEGASAGKKAKKARETRNEEQKTQVDAGATKLKSENGPGSETTAPCPAEEKKETEPSLPFTGYDTGNLLLHASGTNATLFPVDGGQIRAQRTDIEQGTTSVQVTVLKDGHVFVAHIINPQEKIDDSEDCAGIPSRNLGPEKSNRVESSIECSVYRTLAWRSSGENASLFRALPFYSDAFSPGFYVGDKETNAFSERLPVSQFGSTTATLVDGMSLSLSQFGATGQNPICKPYEPEQYSPPVLHTTPPVVAAPAPAPAKGKKSGKHDTNVQAPEMTGSEEKIEKPEVAPVSHQTFQEVFVSCPDGLHVQYFLQSSCGVCPPSAEDRQLVVKQSYPFKTDGIQECEARRMKYAETELSRIVTADGSVLKNMVDGSVEVLHADGTVCIFRGAWLEYQICSSASAPHQPSSNLAPADVPPELFHADIAPKRGKLSHTGKGHPMKDHPVETPQAIAVEENESTEEVEKVKPGTWTITTTNGQCFRRLGLNGPCEELKPVCVCKATDQVTKEIMVSRDDNVVTIYYPDGTTVVEHHDGTRITVYYRQYIATSQGEFGDQDEEDELESPVPLKFVKVECPGYATVEFNCSSSENLTVFGTGTRINVFPDGYYILHHAMGGRIEIDTDATLTYFPCPVEDKSRYTPGDVQNPFELRHNSEVICHLRDSRGNVFDVKSNGDFSVTPSVDMQGDRDAVGQQKQKQLLGDKTLVEYGRRAPRFFIVRRNGSGSELLRHEDFAGMLRSTEHSPATVVIKHPDPSFPGVTGIIVLKPHIGSLSDTWLKKYDRPSIVPTNLHSRDFSTVPARERKKPGPQFGTNVGKGLNVGGVSMTQAKIPIVKTPDALEIRQFVRYKPMTNELRYSLQRALNDYAEYILEQARQQYRMAATDPRSDQERMIAVNVLEAAMSQRNETCDSSEPGTEETFVDYEFDNDYIKELYASAVASPIPSPPPVPKPKRTEEDWLRDRLELEEEAQGLAMLRGKRIPCYFESQMGRKFLLSSAAKDNRTCVGKSYVGTGQMDDKSKQIRGTQRSHSITDDVWNDAWDDLDKGRVSKTKPVIPCQRPRHLAPKGNEYYGNEKQDKQGDKEMNELKHDKRSPQSLTINAAGEPRGNPVRLPRCLHGGRPSTERNVVEIENTIRTYGNKMLVAGATKQGAGNLKHMQGLIMRPEKVNFGALREGNTYSFTVQMLNTGLDPCRYKITQPPPTTGLSVQAKPGPIASGMTVKIQVELNTLMFRRLKAETGVASISHDLEISTQTHIVRLPIGATVISREECDQRIEQGSSGGCAPGVVLVSNRPGAKRRKCPAGDNALGEQRPGSMDEELLKLDL